MEFNQVQELIKLISESNLAEFKLEEGDLKISIRTKHYSGTKVAPAQQIIPVQTGMPQLQPRDMQIAAQPQPVSTNAGLTESDSSTEAEDDNYVYVRSPMVGTFYRSPAPDKGPFVKPGDQISTGDVVCIVEAMKLFNEIESEVSGKIIKILVDDTSPVEYDQALFIVDPQG